MAPIKPSFIAYSEHARDIIRVSVSLTYRLCEISATGHSWRVRRTNRLTERRVYLSRNIYIYKIYVSYSWSFPPALHEEIMERSWDSAPHRMPSECCAHHHGRRRRVGGPYREHLPSGSRPDRSPVFQTLSLIKSSADMKPASSCLPLRPALNSLNAIMAWTSYGPTKCRGIYTISIK